MKGREIRFEEIDVSNSRHFDAFKSWQDDPLMLRNWRRQTEEKAPKSDYTLEEFIRWIRDNPNESYSFMICVNDEPVGYGWFAINFHVVFTKGDRVAWPSIAIGLDKYRNQGLGLEVCKYLYQQAKDKKCSHIEAAAFEFNESMISILESNNFKHIGMHEKATYLDGRWWGAKHYLLEL